MVSKETNKYQTHKNASFIQSLGHAVDGVKTTFIDERNFRFQLLGALIAIILAFLFQLTRIEWIIILLCIYIVISMEFLNTIVENIVDLTTNYQYHELAKKAKDVGAGAVLFSGAISIMIALIIFVPKFIELMFK